MNYLQTELRDERESKSLQSSRKFTWDSDQKYWFMIGWRQSQKFLENVKSHFSLSGKKIALKSDKVEAKSFLKVQKVYFESQKSVFWAKFFFSF